MRHTKCNKKLSKDVDILGVLRDKLRVIIFTRSFQCSDNNVFSTLELAQEHELELLLNAEKGTEPLTAIRVAQLIVLLKAKVLDVLSTTASSRPRGRAINGARRTRKAKDVAPPKAPETAKTV